MADWVTISSLATAGGTLVLAFATYGSTRSANRSARLAELALQEQRRPVLVNSREDDRTQSIGFADRHWLTIPGGGAAVEPSGDVLYLGLSLRNVGAGIAVLQAWRSTGELLTGDAPQPALDEFRPLTRDQYIAPGDVGLWQAALRDPAEPLNPMLMTAAGERRRFTVDLLYTDQIGGQRTISRFGVLPSDGDAAWIAVASHHWYLDAPAPR